MMMFVWTSRFERQGKSEILDLLRQYQNKLVVLPDNMDVARYLVNGEDRIGRRATEELVIKGRRPDK